MLLVALRGCDFDGDLDWGVVSVGGPITMESLPSYLWVYGEDPMDVAQMLLCNQEVVQKVSCVVSWVPPRGFVVLGCPRVSYD